METSSSEEGDKTAALMPTAAEESSGSLFFICAVVPPLRQPEAVQLREKSFYDTVLKFCFLFHNGEIFLPYMASPQNFFPYMTL